METTNTQQNIEQIQNPSTNRDNSQSPTQSPHKESLKKSDSFVENDPTARNNDHDHPQISQEAITEQDHPQINIKSSQPEIEIEEITDPSTQITNKTILAPTIIAPDIKGLILPEQNPSRQESSALSQLSSQNLKEEELQLQRDLDAHADSFKVIFTHLQNKNDQITSQNISDYITRVTNITKDIIGELSLTEVQSAVEAKLHAIIDRKQYYNNGETEQECGITFTEFYHELHMTVLTSLRKKHAAQQHASSFIEVSSAVFDQPSLNKIEINEQELNAIDMDSLDTDSKNRVNMLHLAFSKIKGKIQDFIKQRKNTTLQDIEGTKDLIGRVMDMLSVKYMRINKVIVDEDGDNQMFKKYQTKRYQQDEAQQMRMTLIDAIFEQLNQLDYEGVLQAFLKTAITQRIIDEFELVQRDEQEEANLAELEILDDFLLMDQKDDAVQQSPTLLDRLRESIKMYQMLLDQRKYKGETERQKILAIIKNMQKQIDQIMRDQVKQNKAEPALDPSNPFAKLFQMIEQDRSSPAFLKASGPEDHERLSKINDKREKTLRGIFDFYCRQQLLVGKRATFEQIQNKTDHMNMGEFIRFCIDFSIPLTKAKLIECFKKMSTNHKDLNYEQFGLIIQRLFFEINKDRARELKKKLAGIKQQNFIGVAVFQDIQKQLLAIKNKSPDEIKEEAYQFLELDQPSKVESKKKGLSLPFHVRDKDSVLQASSPERRVAKPSVPPKSRQYTAEQKAEIKEMVQRIKEERESKRKNGLPFINQSKKYQEQRQKIVSSSSKVSSVPPSEALQQQSTPYLSENKPSISIVQQKSLKKESSESLPQPKRQILTLQKLTQLTYTELNSKAEDDFDPAQFGFETAPILPLKQSGMLPHPSTHTVGDYSAVDFQQYHDFMVTPQNRNNPPIYSYEYSYPHFNQVSGRGGDYTNTSLQERMNNPWAKGAVMVSDQTGGTPLASQFNYNPHIAAINNQIQNQSRGRDRSFNAPQQQQQILAITPIKSRQQPTQVNNSAVRVRSIQGSVGQRLPVMNGGRGDSPSSNWIDQMYSKLVQGPSTNQLEKSPNNSYHVNPGDDYQLKQSNLVKYYKRAQESRHGSGTSQVLALPPIPLKNNNRRQL